MVAFGLAAGFSLGGLVAAQAQSPSADQIIRSLQPGAGMSGATRGIRPVAPAPEPPGNVTPGSVTPATLPRSGPGPAPHAGSPPPRTAAAMPSVNLTVNFPTNSAELTPAATRTLNELGRALSSQALAGFRFRIEGHTDTVGSPEANRMLSERRAATVVEYLVGRFGVDRSRLEAAGMGQDGLLVQTPPQSAEPRNRRVQVVNLGA